MDAIIAGFKAPISMKSRLEAHCERTGQSQAEALRRFLALGLDWSEAQDSAQALQGNPKDVDNFNSLVEKLQSAGCKLFASLDAIGNRGYSVDIVTKTGTYGASAETINRALELAVDALTADDPGIAMALQPKAPEPLKPEAQP